MSDKLFVRDIIERLQTLDPGLLTNLAEISTGSYPDGTRVRFADEQQVEDRFHENTMSELARQRRQAYKELDDLQKRRDDLVRELGTERVHHEKKLEALRLLARRIKQNALKRPLPLP